MGHVPYIISPVWFYVDWLAVGVLQRVLPLRFLPRIDDADFDLSLPPPDGFDVQKPTLPDPDDVEARTPKYSNRTTFDTMVARAMGVTDWEAGLGSWRFQ